MGIMRWARAFSFVFPFLEQEVLVAYNLPYTIVLPIPFTLHRCQRVQVCMQVLVCEREKEHLIVSSSVLHSAIVLEPYNNK